MTAFFSLNRFLIRKPVVRNFFNIFINAFFLLMAVLLTLHGVFAPPWIKPEVEWAWLLIAVLPVLIYSFRRKHFERLSEQYAAPREHFNQLKEEFLSMASHELRTPLSVISGFAEILLREKLGPLNDEQKRRIRKILMQAERLTRILNELLDLSRIRSGKVQVHRQVFALVPVLKACLDDHQVVCEQQKIELKDEIPDVVPDVLGDLERVTQILVNLLNNAIKYTDVGGTITVGVSHDPAHRAVRVEVRDTGIGIDPLEQPRVFEEFYRVTNHQSARKYSGTGLGLAIVKQLVETQGGRVGIHSEGLGKGSCFYFTLPAAA